MSRERQPRLLIIDDEEPVRELLSRFLQSRGFETAEAASGEDALRALKEGDFALALCDVQMPGMSGIAVLDEIRRAYPEVGVVMLTGSQDVHQAVEAMKLGAFDYVLKPFSLEKVEAAIRAALQRKAMQRRNEDRLRNLEREVHEQTARLRTVLSDLDHASEGTLEALVTALDAREHETQAHSRRVAEYAVYLAREMGIRNGELEAIRRGAMLHDIGKIGISDEILLKPAALTDAEWREMRRHPQIGFWILNGIESLRPAAEIVLHHHERYDGGGYPRRLRGEAIPLSARIFAVADSLDAITSDRPYHRGRSFQTARQEIASGSGAQFDPVVVESFLRIPPEVWAGIRNRIAAETGRPATDLPQLVQESCRQNN